MKFCRDCIWRAGELCHHEKARSYNLVTGDESLLFCSVMRMSGERCGSEGRLWEAVPDTMAIQPIPDPPF